ncbi:flagellar M-ring protein FliF [Gammaproteobacteria bacterium 45_16_T64]|nr:flagellar M-ring protein FliF [Gammaproteobacteria bacterium 45_16_T64]
MSTIREFWMDLGAGQKTSLLLAAFLIVALPLFALTFLYKSDTAILYSDIRSEDAAAIVGRLEELKIEYELSGDGNTILVAKDDLYATRLKMVGKDGPVTGSAGFELFDDADYGMTEFTQKVNLKRAMQGELERTISSLDEVKFARVHLVIPEAVLFKKDQKHPKASVTLVLQNGMSVTPEQVAGIQLLIASSVDRLDSEKVIVLDGQGRMISAAGDDLAMYGKKSMDRARTLELHLEVKAQKALDMMFGVGKSVVSVNVDLSSKTVERIVEKVLPVQGKAKGMLAKRKHTKTVNNASKGKTKKGASLADVKENTEEVFEFGRSRENSVEEPGAVKRLTISVLLPTNLTNTRISEVESVIKNSVGYKDSRGDQITVVSVLGRSLLEATPLALIPGVEEGVSEGVAQEVYRDGYFSKEYELLILVVGIALCFSSIVLVVALRRKPQRLTIEERDRLLDDIQLWLSDNKETALIEVGK